MNSIGPFLCWQTVTTDTRSVMTIDDGGVCQAVTKTTPTLIKFMRKLNPVSTKLFNTNRIFYHAQIWTVMTISIRLKLTLLVHLCVNVTAIMIYHWHF